MRLLPGLAAALILAGTASHAGADTVTFAISNPQQSITTSGGRLTFTASVSAPSSNAGLEYLNGLSYNITPANGFTIDDDAFFADYPLSLAPGQSYSGALFSVIVPAGSAAGPYAGTVDLLGGATDGSFATLASQNFNVRIAASPVPEPATWAAIVLGLGAIGVTMRRRERSTGDRRVA